MTHLDSLVSEEDFQPIKSQTAMIKRGAFKFFSLVLARKIVDPPLSERDATPSLISSGLGEDWASGQREPGSGDPAGRAAEPGTGLWSPTKDQP